MTTDQLIARAYISATERRLQDRRPTLSLATFLLFAIAHGFEDAELYDPGYVDNCIDIWIDNGATVVPCAD